MQPEHAILARRGQIWTDHLAETPTPYLATIKAVDGSLALFGFPLCFSVAITRIFQLTQLTRAERAAR